MGLVPNQYNAGKTDFNRVVNVEQLLTQQQDQLAVAQGTVANNLVLLYKALGGGWQTNFCQSPSQTAAAAQSGDATPVLGPIQSVPLQQQVQPPPEYPYHN